LKEKAKEILQEIEDMLHYKLIWDAKTKKFKKMLVYKKDELKDDIKPKSK